MRAVLDPNVLIAALLSPRGTPGRVFRAWLDGIFELVISAALLGALKRALAYPKLRRRTPAEDAQALIELLTRTATLADDRPRGSTPLSSPDPGDDYLLALACQERAALVSSDNDLLSIEADLPIYSPSNFIERIEQS